MTAWSLERRRRPRFPLRWRASIRRDGQNRPTRAETVNLSCGGLYCIAAEPFVPGDRLEISLHFPEELDPRHRALRLRCMALVVRVEPAAGGHAYGMACSIQDYAVVEGERPAPDAEPPGRPHARAGGLD
jgi:hypothetical protein